MINLKVKKLHPDAVIPTYGTDGAACFDLYAVEANKRPAKAWAVTDFYPVIFRTGLSFEVPKGWAMLIYSRSGHGFKNDVRLANCVGVIDADFCGELMVKLTGDTHSQLAIKPGDRIAQGMLVPVTKVHFEEVQELSETVRGVGGFGSTGA
tara:strand:+ start:20740 stop:21192 length:453 start_codon:yes stop_codon:yes gene_type:complete